MSHEIRSPLNAIIGLTHLLDHTKLEPKQRDYLSSILAASRALLAVVDDVLDLSKIEAEEMTIERVPFELAVLLDDVRAMMTPQAELKGLKLWVRVARGTPEAFRGDITRLRQILTNLVGNAIKFTERGYVELTVSCVERDDTKARLRCAVRDTGIGIAPEAMPRLFAPFTQADTSTTRRFGGTGLGLSIVKQLVTLMGGEVDVHSEPNVGSEFWVIVPLDVCEASSVEPTYADPRRAVDDPTNTASLLGVHVLVVDDSEVNREVVRGILEREGATVSACTTGQEALELLQQQPRTFHLVLMDVQMPVMDGHEATRQLRKQGLASLPVIALTAGALSGERQRALEAGMNDFLTKPLEPRLLIRTVRRYAERASRDLLHPQVAARRVSGIEPAWPQVAGIDSEKAAERFDHDVERFTSLLATFVREYENWKWTEVPHVTQTQARREIANHAHKLCGAAGVMAAPEISALALRIDTALSRELEAPELATAFCELQSSLRALAQSARPLLEAHSRKATRPAEPA
jgi:CheY-like chemotaxis protein/HPt (histidine-containing phosphotransfer) domain-containing protein/two-component sensor histidine kinase